MADETEPLIQKHLDIWKMFNTTGGTPFGNSFAGKVDMNRIGTMGHSLGGHAIVDHYAFNLRRVTLRDIRSITFKFDRSAGGALLFSDLTFVATPGLAGDRFVGK